MFFFQNKNKIKGFTLIELLIVIVIIGILATSLIPRIQGMQDKARYTRVQKDFQDFRAIALLAQNNTNKVLGDIVGDFDVIHPDCYESGSIISDLRFIESNHICRSSWVAALRKLETAAGISQGSLSSLEKDPWGSPYGLDPNEGEILGPYNICDRKDLLYTGGPDGNIFTSHTGLVSVLLFAPSGCPGGY